MNLDENKIIADPLFKGCTRPAMTLGVPTKILGSVMGVLLLGCIYVSWTIAVLIPFAIVIMRQIVANDDQQFRLLGLKLYFRLVKFNKNGAFWRASCFSPLKFVKRKVL